MCLWILEPNGEITAPLRFVYAFVSVTASIFRFFRFFRIFI
jgi:hypothetical protein